MAPKTRSHRERTKHYIKEWREYRGLTQERAIERLGWSQSKISRLERGETPYDEFDLAAASVAYNCSPSDLISVNPLVEGDVIDIMGMLRTAEPGARNVAKRILKELLDKKDAG